MPMREPAAPQAAYQPSHGTILLILTPMPADSPITRQIAEGAKGNVRAAMADLEVWMG